MIQWPLAALRRLQIEPIVVVVGFDADRVKKACGPGVSFAQQDEPRGTAHAVLAAAPLFDGFAGDLLILNGDLPMIRPESLQRLLDTHRERSSLLTIATAEVADPRGWGRIIRRDGAVERIVEEKDASGDERAVREVNVGLYCVAAHLLFPYLHRLTPDNAQGELYLTDLVDRAVRDGVGAHPVRIDAAEVGQINSRAEWAAMEKTLRERINAKWMAEGVTLQDPETTYIDPEVEIGEDTFIGPNVHLRGRTKIGKNCRIDGTAFITDATISSGVHVKFAVVMTECEVGAGCQVGPFAQLRPGTRLSEEVHIGDFVETKNAVIGPRSKANHLAYLGDTEIGAESNIGAGTITCNYDGFRKHRTVIGDRVQVGSDSQLVAPVRLGDDVYVATGTTVRRDVPDGAMVFNRKEELQREGWVAEFRARAQASDRDDSKDTDDGKDIKDTKR